MHAKSRNAAFHTAAAELGFALAAFACGLFDAPLLACVAVALAMVAHWSWSRRRILNRLRPRTWAIQSGLAICVLIAIQAGAYWLGMMSRF